MLERHSFCLLESEIARVEKTCGARMKYLSPLAVIGGEVDGRSHRFMAAYALSHVLSL
jgi:hypothetical protein